MQLQVNYQKWIKKYEICGSTISARDKKPESERQNIIQNTEANTKNKLNLKSNNESELKLIKYAKGFKTLYLENMNQTSPKQKVSAYIRNGFILKYIN